MKEFDRSSVDTFAKLDKDYELLVTRMSNFDQQVNEGSVPKKTISIFVKELGSYLSVLEEEIKKNEQLITTHSQKSDTMKHEKTVGLGQIKLTLKKLQIIEAQIQNVYNKRKNHDTKNTKQTSHSAELLWTYKELGEKFLKLYDQYQSLNGKHVFVHLDDSYEAEIEKDDGFLRKEVDYLTNLTNMLTKISLTHKLKNEFCKQECEELKKTWRDSWTQESFVIAGDIHQSNFKKEYDQRLRSSERRLASANKIHEIFSLLHQLEDYEQSNDHAKLLLRSVKQTLSWYDVHLILKDILEIVRVQDIKETLWYLQKKELLLEPFSYGGSFAMDEIELIIRGYLHAVHQSTPSQLKKLEIVKQDIQSNLDQITMSLAKIKNYKYLPFESLQQAINKTISVSTRSGERWNVRKKLIKKIEWVYTKQYQYLIWQVGQLTSGWRRGNSSGADILGDLLGWIWNVSWRSRGGRSFGGGGWWRSLGGGSSFSGGWSSSGGTSR